MLLRDKCLLLALCSFFSPGSSFSFRHSSFSFCHFSSFAFFRISSCSSSSHSSSFLFHSLDYFSCSFSLSFFLCLLFCLSDLSFCWTLFSFSEHSCYFSSSSSEHFCDFSCSLPPSSFPCQDLPPSPTWLGQTQNSQPGCPPRKTLRR